MGLASGVVHQLTGVVIATRQPRNPDPAHPCNIHTRPLLLSSSTDSSPPLTPSPFDDLLFRTRSVSLLSNPPAHPPPRHSNGRDKRNRANIMPLSSVFFYPRAIFGVYTPLIAHSQGEICAKSLNFRNNRINYNIETKLLKLSPMIIQFF